MCFRKLFGLGKKEKSGVDVYNIFSHFLAGIAEELEIEMELESKDEKEKLISFLFTINNKCFVEVSLSYISENAWFLGTQVLDNDKSKESTNETIYAFSSSDLGKITSDQELATALQSKQEKIKKVLGKAASTIKSIENEKERRGFYKSVRKDKN
ncbi:MAG TPA: hypothetical protein VJI68_01360 [Candidatus Nanoarchaeia archaeon]|nr:hypothetical protein [Candidatus Nanoarchaeia archaeon]